MLTKKKNKKHPSSQWSKGANLVTRVLSRSLSRVEPGNYVAPYVDFYKALFQVNCLISLEMNRGSGKFDREVRYNLHFAIDHIEYPVKKYDRN